MSILVLVLLFLLTMMLLLLLLVLLLLLLLPLVMMLDFRSPQEAFESKEEIGASGGGSLDIVGKCNLFSLFLETILLVLMFSIKLSCC